MDTKFKHVLVDATMKHLRETDRAFSDLPHAARWDRAEEYLDAWAREVAGQPSGLPTDIAATASTAQPLLIDLRQFPGKNSATRLRQYLAATRPGFADLPHATQCREASLLRQSARVIY